MVAHNAAVTPHVTRTNRRCGEKISSSSRRLRNAYPCELPTDVPEWEGCMGILPREANYLVQTRSGYPRRRRPLQLGRTNATVTKKMMFVIGGTGQYRRP